MTDSGDDQEEDLSSTVFAQLSTQEQGDDGMPTGNQVLSKSDCRKMAEKVISSKKSLSTDETSSYLKINFNRIWTQHDSSQG